MKIDVTELLKEVGSEESFEGEETASYPEDDLVTTEPIKIKVKLINTGKTILMLGKFKTRVKLNCVRCLKDFEYPMDVEIEEEYSKIKPSPKGGPKIVELKGIDFVFKIEDDNTIDLSEAMRQNLLTSLPMKPLCKPDCQGIEKG